MTLFLLAALTGLLQTRAPTEWHYEISASVTFETFLGVGNVIPGARYDSAFRSGTGVSAEAAATYTWVPPFWDLDTTFRPLVGYSYRTFVGDNFNSPVYGLVEVDSLSIQTGYVGFQLAAGSEPDSTSPGIMTYLDFHAGASFIDPVKGRSGALPGGKTLLFDRTIDLYLAGGIGLRASYDILSLSAEFGFRGFGAPTPGNGAILTSGSKLIIAYVLVGASVSF